MAVPFERGEPDGTKDDAVVVETTMSTGAAFVIPLAVAHDFAGAILPDLIAPALTQSRRAACQALAMGGARIVGAVWSPTGETADRNGSVPSIDGCPGQHGIDIGMEVRHP